MYSTMKDGPDHYPRFNSSVSVNGLLFHSPFPSKSSKDAQNAAAKLAFLHFTGTFHLLTGPAQPKAYAYPKKKKKKKGPLAQNFIKLYIYILMVVFFFLRIFFFFLLVMPRILQILL